MIKTWPGDSAVYTQAIASGALGTPGTAIPTPPFYSPGEGAARYGVTPGGYGTYPSPKRIVQTTGNDGVVSYQVDF